MKRFGYDFAGDPTQFDRLVESDADSWNEWRKENPTTLPSLWVADLEGKSLANRDLRGADLRLADLRGADLRGADLRDARLRAARLEDADLRGANLQRADLAEAELDQGGLVRFPAVLRGAKLADCCLREANLTAADLTYAQLVGVDLSNAKLNGASVYGIATWDVNLSGAEQKDLRITRHDQPYMSVDRLELAQFIYLLIESAKMRDVLDALSSTTVLILGRFEKQRKEYLDLVRDEIRNKGYIPIVFDFEKPASADLTGTVEVLARLSRFVFVDLSDPLSVPHELATIVPFLRKTPVQPLLDVRTKTYGMFPDLSSYPWVMRPKRYRSQKELKALLPAAISAAEKKSAKLKH